MNSGIGIGYKDKKSIAVLKKTSAHKMLVLTVGTNWFVYFNGPQSLSIIIIIIVTIINRPSRKGDPWL